MTGYGRGVADHGGKRAIIEIRSVNHRFLDLKLRGAPLEPGAEERLCAAIRKQCERGAITVSVRTEERDPAAGLHVDRDAARRVHAELAALATELGIAEPVTLELLCAQPGVMVSQDSPADIESLAACIEAATIEAVAGLVRMRQAEGAALARDLVARVSRIGELAGELARHTAVAPEEAARRLEERVGRLLARSQMEVDPARMAQEVAILADRLDVTEELVRLHSHLEQVREIVAGEGAIGRRLDFLVQEIGRELNTISSKSQSADIAQAVVEAKAELEKIREQVQNIE